MRNIDVVLRNPKNGRTLGVECKYQAVGGTAEEKIPTTIQDISAWPIAGIVAFSGRGFTTNMKFFLVSTGKAVEFDDLEPWLRLYFGLPLD
jgi:PD-(D/E)XK nuclease superfamily protein